MFYADRQVNSLFHIVLIISLRRLLIMKANRSLEITVKCYFAEESTDVSKILKESLVVFIKKQLEKSRDQTLDFLPGMVL